MTSDNRWTAVSARGGELTSASDGPVDSRHLLSHLTGHETSTAGQGQGQSAPIACAAVLPPIR